MGRPQQYHPASYCSVILTKVRIHSEQAFGRSAEWMLIFISMTAG
jgi:hypothetical protein